MCDLTRCQRHTLELLREAPLERFHSGWGPHPEQATIQPSTIASLGAMGFLRVIEPRPRHAMALITERGRLALATEAV